MLSNKRYVNFLILWITFTTASCKKFVDIPAPNTSTNGDNVYLSDPTAIGVLNGIYANFSTSSTFIQGNKGISLLSGLSADEFTLMSGANASLTGYYTNALWVDATTNIGSDFWNPLYEYIYTCNSAIEGLSKSTSLTPAVREQLLGEAKFLRAFCFFYLTNLFGDVPLVLTTNYSINATMARSAKSDVYEQIINDLKDAQELLDEGYLNGNLKPYSGSIERVRPNKAAATALLARVYLYTDNWIKAEEQASIIINNKVLYDTIPLNQVFLKNSKEAIWQLQPVAAGSNTQDARIFIITSSGLNSNNPVKLSTSLLNGFEIGDKRGANGNWINSITVGGNTLNYPYKFKIYANNPDITSSTGTTNMVEYHMVLRLAEQYLIRAEARVQQNNIAGGVADLNTIRKRARATPTVAAPNPLPDLATSLTQTQVLDAILKERKVELFSEWGHRWLDLKRTGKIDEVMNAATPEKANGGTWRAYQQLYPIPFTELQRNPFLEQTPGYY